MGELLQARGLQIYPGPPGELRVASGDPVVDAAASLEVERRSPSPHGPWWSMEQAGGGRDRAVQHRIGAGYSVPLPRCQDPQPLCASTTPERRKPWRARCRETGTAGSASCLGKRTGSNPGTAPQADSTSKTATIPHMGEVDDRCKDLTELRAALRSS